MIERGLPFPRYFRSFFKSFKIKKAKKSDFTSHFMNKGKINNAQYNIINENKQHIFL